MGIQETLTYACVALLGVLVFGLGFLVSSTRARTRNAGAVAQDGKDLLYRHNRAHGNTIEYAPMLAVLFLALLFQEGTPLWAFWLMLPVTLCRYAHAAGMLMSQDLRDPEVLRAVGSIGTYLGGFVLCCVALFNALR